MTVTDLMRNFQAGLVCLLPCVQYVGIPWKRPDAYDEWDDLASAIYQALIVGPLRTSLPEDEREGFSLPDYDLLIPKYSGHSVIELLPAHSERSILVFHALASTDHPFDTVEWRAIEPDGSPTSDLLESSPLEGARFALRRSIKGFASERMEEIAIPSGRSIT